MKLDYAVYAEAFAAFLRIAQEHEWEWLEDHEHRPRIRLPYEEAAMLCTWASVNSLANPKDSWAFARASAAADVASLLLDDACAKHPGAA